MENQQLSALEERVRFLGINAVFGDGYLWKHPETKNYKVIYTSTTPELLEVKRLLCPEIFKTGVVLIPGLEKRKDRYANAKPMYRLSSIIHPIFTELKSVPKEVLFKELTLEHFGLWYLDDGCTWTRTYKDSVYNRFALCIGDTVNTPERLKLFKETLERLFGSKYGNIQYNGRPKSENNKVWNIPVGIAREYILPVANKYGVLPHKFPYGESSTTIRKE